MLAAQDVIKLAGTAYPSAVPTIIDGVDRRFIIKGLKARRRTGASRRDELSERLRLIVLSFWCIQLEMVNVDGKDVPFQQVTIHHSLSTNTSTTLISLSPLLPPPVSGQTVPTLPLRPLIPPFDSHSSLFTSESIFLRSLQTVFPPLLPIPHQNFHPRFSITFAITPRSTNTTKHLVPVSSPA